MIAACFAIGAGVVCTLYSFQGSVQGFTEFIRNNNNNNNNNETNPKRFIVRYLTDGNATRAAAAGGIK